MSIFIFIFILRATHETEADSYFSPPGPIQRNLKVIPLRLVLARGMASAARLVREDRTNVAPLAGDTYGLNTRVQYMNSGLVVGSGSRGSL